MSTESASAIQRNQVDLVDFVEWLTAECSNQKPGHSLSNALKRDDREDEGLNLESDAQKQLFIYIPFTEAIQLHSIVIKGPEEEGPKTVKLFANKVHMSFRNVNDYPPSDTAVLSEDNLKGKQVILKCVKFQNVRSLTIFIEDNQSGSNITKVQKIVLHGMTREVASPNISQKKKAKNKLKKKKKPQFTPVDDDVPSVLQIREIANKWKPIAMGNSGTVAYKGSSSLIGGNLQFNVDLNIVVKSIPRDELCMEEEVETLLGRRSHYLHQNLVRQFGVQFRENTVYQVMESCHESLSAILSRSTTRTSSRKGESVIIELEVVDGKKYTVCLGEQSQNLKLIIREIVIGIFYLHKKSSTYHNIKPDNIFIGKDGCVKIDFLSLDPYRGKVWVPPEYFVEGSTLTSLGDMFDLGRLLIALLKGGEDDFPVDWGEYEKCFRSDDYDTTFREQIVWPMHDYYEAYALVYALLDRDPTKRPTVEKVLNDSLFWDNWKRLRFLQVVHQVNRGGLDAQITDEINHIQLECYVSYNVSCWKEMIPSTIDSDLSCFSYGDQIEDLVGYIRNLHQHEKEKSQDTQELLRDGFTLFFTQLYPDLVPKVHGIIANKYWNNLMPPWMKRDFKDFYEDSSTWDIARLTG